LPAGRETLRGALDISGSCCVARRAIGSDSGYYIANARTGRPDPDRTPDRNMTNKEEA